MTRLLALIFVLLLVPGSISAATLAAEETLTISEAAEGNAYLAGTNVRVTAPIVGDVAALGTSLLLLAPIRGDALLLGGTIEAAGPVDGDLRAFGGRVTVEGTATGDIFAVGGSVRVEGRGEDLRLFGVNVAALGGGGGLSEIYGSTVTIGGEFAGDVRVFASDRLIVRDGTRIAGTLEYDAPQQADVPENAVIDGGVVYTGTSSFLPTSKEAETFAIAGAGLFLIVRVIAGMVAAGLAALLFPSFSRRIADRVLTGSARRFVMLALLGFAVFVATPLLALLLMLSFVGAGVGLLLAIAYLFLLLVSFIYAGVITGAAIARFALKREGISWRGALLGMLVLHLIGLIPIAGSIVTAVLCAAATGAIASAAYHFMFGRDTADA